MLVEKKVYLENIGWTTLLKEHIKDVDKVLLYQKKDTTERLLLCGGFPFVKQHINLVKLYKLDLSEYSMIGAADMNKGILTNKRSVGYKFNTEKKELLEMIDYLFKPETEGVAKYFLENW